MRARSRGRRAAALVVAGYALLLGAWIVTNPAFAAPDEPAQYLRALSIAGGDLGRTPTWPMPSGSHEEEWFRRLTRTVDVPARLAPAGQIPCFAFDSSTTAACDDLGTPFDLTARDRLALDPTASLSAMVARLDVAGTAAEPRLQRTSYVGAYPPFVLAPAGLAGRLGDSPTSGLLLARFGGGVGVVVLLGVGWWWLLDGAAAAVRAVGGLVALTPMTLFVGATTSSSGVEIAAGFAVASGLVRLGRPGVVLSSRSLLGLGACGAVLFGARQFGPMWLAITVALGALGGGNAWRQRLADGHRRAALAAAGIAGAGAAATAVWSLAFATTPPTRTARSSFGTYLDQAVGDLRRLGRELVGVFGWLDSPVPRGVYLVWGGMAIALVVAASILGGRSQRRLLVALAAAVLAAAFVASAVAYRFQAGAQGRWLLPLVVALPVVAGEVAARRWPPGSRRAPTGALRAAAIVVAGLHLVALWVNARRYAVGLHGPLWFVDDSRWSPPGGWWVGVAAAGLGALAVVVGAWRVAGDDDRAVADALAGAD